MALRLLDEDSEFSLEIPTDSVLSEAIYLQLRRMSEASQQDQYMVRLSQILANALGSSLDTDLQAPTAAQLKYGIDISRVLGISLPADALRYRGAMHEFISRHVDLFKVRTQPQSGVEAHLQE